MHLFFLQNIHNCANPKIHVLKQAGMQNNSENEYDAMFICFSANMIILNLWDATLQY